MSRTKLNPTPGPAEVFKEQFRALTIARRRVLILFGFLFLILAGLLVWATAGEPEGGPAFVLFGMAGTHSIALIIGALWPLEVWRGEGPSERAYHWSQPVDRSIHDLTRVAAGGLWVLIGITFFTALFALTFYANPALDAVPGPLPPVSYWLNYLTGPVVAYLLGSVAGLLTERVGVWIIGVPVGWTLFGAVAGIAPGGEPIARAMDLVIDGRFGLSPALNGAIADYWSVASTHVDPARLPGGEWLPATLLWTAIGVACVLAASRVHRDV